MSLQESSSTPCKYYKVGHCKFGNSCHFIHPPNCIIPQCPKLSCPNRHPCQCKYYSKFGSCKYSDNCSFSHYNAPSSCPSTQSPSAYEELFQEIQTLKLSIVSLTQWLDESDSLLSALQQQLLKNHPQQLPLSATPSNIPQQQPSPNIFSFPPKLTSLDTKYKSFSCSQCNYQCSLEIVFKRHITRKHKNSPLPVSTPQTSPPIPFIDVCPHLGQTFKCNICYSIFPTISSLMTVLSY